VGVFFEDRYDFGKSLNFSLNSIQLNIMAEYEETDVTVETSETVVEDSYGNVEVVEDTTVVEQETVVETDAYGDTYVEQDTTVVEEETVVEE